MSKVGTKNYLKNNGFVVMVSSIMASESPTTEYKDAFMYPPPGRSTPPLTTPAKHESSLAIDPGPTTSKPEKEEEFNERKEKDKDELELPGPRENPGYKPDDRVKSENSNHIKDDKDKSDTMKLNSSDELDTRLMLPLEAKEKGDDIEEESCTVNCLYYTMQCCECTIS